MKAHESHPLRLIETKNALSALHKRGSLDQLHVAAALEFKDCYWKAKDDSGELRANDPSRVLVDGGVSRGPEARIDAMRKARATLAKIEAMIKGVYGDTGWNIVVCVTCDNMTVRQFCRDKLPEAEFEFGNGLLRLVLGAVARELNIRPPTDCARLEAA